MSCETCCTVSDKTLVVQVTRSVGARQLPYFRISLLINDDDNAEDDEDDDDDDDVNVIIMVVIVVVVAVVLSLIHI